MKIPKVKIIERNVKYARISLKTGNVVLILPPNLNNVKEEILERNKEWILRKLKLIKELKKEAKKLRIVKRSRSSLEKLIKKYIEEFKEYLKVEPKVVKISKLKVRWGYCSFEKLVFNEAMKNLPAELVKYIVFHEMCHLIFRNHKKEFWNLIKTKYPNYQKTERKLNAYWWKLFRR